MMYTEKEIITLDIQQAYKLKKQRVRRFTSEYLLTTILLENDKIKLMGELNKEVHPDLKMKGKQALYNWDDGCTYLYSVDERLLIQIYRGRVLSRVRPEANLVYWKDFRNYVKYGVDF